jgi:hypothetical protein
MLFKEITNVYSENHKKHKPYAVLDFPFSAASTLALGPTQPPIQWVSGFLSQGVKSPGRVADHSSPSTAEVKNGGAILPLPHTSSWHIG